MKYKNSVRSVLIKYLSDEFTGSEDRALEMLQETVKETWIPEINKKYYFVSATLKINWYFWSNDEIDIHLLESNNVFKTKEEAEVKADQIKKLLKGE